MFAIVVIVIINKVINQIVMETIISNITDSIVNDFDFTFCVIVNIITYLIISLITDTTTYKIGTWAKRIVFLIISILVGIFYYFTGSSLQVIFNSVILAPVSWSWIFKPICKRFNIDYSKTVNSKEI